MTLAASGSRVRLSVFEENRRRPRCTGSHPERMRPHRWPLLDMTPLVLRAHFGSSRVREDLPRLVREVGRSCAGSAIHSPAPTDTRFVRRSRSMRCGRRKRDLGSPRAAVPTVRFYPTPRIGIDQSDIPSRRKHDGSQRKRDRLAGECCGFALRRRELPVLALGEGFAPRDRAAQPISLHSRPLEARWQPEKPEGKSLPQRISRTM